MSFASLDSGGFELAPGAVARSLFGKTAMLNVVEMEADAVVAMHSHPHEQLGLILAGSMRMVVDGVAHECGPMTAYVLPGGVEHGATAGPRGATVLDVFVPVREDYRERAQTAR
jgi:quercetin dioxygenase-like cupin family protein